MKTAHQLIIALASLTISACTVAPKKAEGSFEYINAKVSQPIVVSEGLDKPKHNPEFDIPSTVVKRSIGESISVFPPRLLMALAEGSRVDEQDPHSTIWFEQTEDIANLEATIWDAFTHYFQDKNIPLVKSDRATGFIETSWVPHVIETGWWLWETDIVVESRRFTFKVDMKPHGRTGTVKVDLIERKAEGFTRASSLKAEENPGLATDMLNSLIGHFDYRLRLAAEQRRAEYAKGVVVETYTDTNDEMSMIVKARFGHAWLRTLDAMNKLGFVITDLNKIEGRVYGRINKKNVGLWDSLFGEEKQSELAFEPGDYVIELIRKETETEVVFTTNNLEAVSNDILKQVFPEFIEIMGKNID
ncbi:outer membrane protein assembly factor BamC [Algibacillus agarilyticus]|uniref:outer membrane protein assembly factor BamC n=1 Tax=Algibacillus agarilyticus TaxID=2234133 RepID=UPI0013002187|nr:outer membrane protein assembly factor BamC [Algibacillus agarilyticus]